ncbi:MAG: hypothetical protein AB1390_03425 [Nitrospirota bacterium]
MRRGAIIFGLVFLIFLHSSAHAEEQKPSEEGIYAIVPAENAEVVAKKPDIKIGFSIPVVLETLVVLLDSTDVTQLVTATDRGFEFTPFQVLAAGTHTLSITVENSEGMQIQKSIVFSNRHSGVFQEAYTDNEASVNYEAVLKKPDEATSLPYSKVEGNLRSDTKIREKGWSFAFQTNVRYLDQSLPVGDPLQKGFTIVNWILTGSYIQDAFKVNAEVGDVQVNETPFTVSGLARRGGVIGFEYGDVQVNAFSVRSEQVYGLHGIGIEGSTEDHILGVSGGVKLFDKRLEFKTIFATGGEPGSSYGISTVAGKKKGDVIGFLLKSDFFENKMTTEFETAFSEHDPDDSDEFGGDNDMATRLKIGGTLGWYNYSAMYEYIGRDYAVVGNQMIQKDKQGVNIMNGMNIDAHALNLGFSWYHDNVKGDRLFPRIVNYVYSLDYSCSKIPSLPLGINYQKSIQNSRREPADSSEIDTYTDTISGRVNYSQDRINIGFQTAYSLLNDRTPANSDTTTITYTLIPSYSVTGVSLMPSFSLNQSKNHVTDIWTDTYTINMDLRTTFFRERASFDVGGTYSIVKGEEDTADNRTLSTNFRLAYNIKGILKGFLNPIIALRGMYTKFTDDISPNADRDEFTILLVLAATIPFSF